MADAARQTRPDSSDSAWRCSGSEVLGSLFALRFGRKGGNKEVCYIQDFIRQFPAVV
jgi:hypothetical protein